MKGLVVERERKLAMAHVLFGVTLALIVAGIFGGFVISTFLFLLIPAAFAILAVA
jgi:hypothetical protein